jgi:hypothetical protein
MLEKFQDGDDVLGKKNESHQSILMGIELNVESFRNWSPFVKTEILFTWKALYLGIDFKC